MPLRKRDDTLFELTCEEEINFFFFKKLLHKFWVSATKPEVIPTISASFCLGNYSSFPLSLHVYEKYLFHLWLEEWAYGPTRPIYTRLGIVEKEKLSTLGLPKVKFQA